MIKDDEIFRVYVDPKIDLDSVPGGPPEKTAFINEMIGHFHDCIGKMNTILNQSTEMNIFSTESANTLKDLMIVYRGDHLQANHRLYSKIFFSICYRIL